MARLDEDFSRDFSGLLGVYGIGCGLLYLIHWSLLKIEKTTLQLAGDEITLNDYEIRLVRTDGTQTFIPRKGLRVRTASGMIYEIWNMNVPNDKIVLTSYMENAKELIDTIEPGMWDWSPPD